MYVYTHTYIHTPCIFLTHVHTFTTTHIHTYMYVLQYTYLQFQEKGGSLSKKHLYTLRHTLAIGHSYLYTMSPRTHTHIHVYASIHIPETCSFRRRGDLSKKHLYTLRHTSARVTSTRCHHAHAHTYIHVICLDTHTCSFRSRRALAKKNFYTLCHTLASHFHIVSSLEGQNHFPRRRDVHHAFCHACKHAWRQVKTA
jgi:hypothetical protein